MGQQGTPGTGCSRDITPECNGLVMARGALAFGVPSWQDSQAWAEDNFRTRGITGCAKSQGWVVGRSNKLETKKGN